MHLIRVRAHTFLHRSHEIKSIYIATLKERKERERTPGEMESRGEAGSNARKSEGEEKEGCVREVRTESKGDKGRSLAFVPFDRWNLATFRSRAPRTRISLRTTSFDENMRSAEAGNFLLRDVFASRLKSHQCDCVARKMRMAQI